ncbi:hypothetical protein PIB30_028145 [Stylosanthes scabra]|uniref:Uncharacterized protein n=1 Tax=Stylosanthes scabra TaxID=79078 RepID=A0ABU6X916_9FABA|nr:hypothetical protein [Stylosanthes scabra]
MEKNKKKRKNRALARPHPPGGAAAGSENAIFLATGATAPPRPSYDAPPWPARAVSLATFGRSYQVAWRARTLLLVCPHSSRARAMALVRPRGSTNGNDNGANSDDEHTKDWISSRLYTCARRTVPSSSVGRANAKDKNSGLF